MYACVDTYTCNPAALHCAHIIQHIVLTTHTYKHMNGYIHTCQKGCKRMQYFCVCMHVNTCMHKLHLCIYMYIRKKMQTHASFVLRMHLHAYVDMRMYTCVWIHAQIIHIHAQSLVYMRIYMHKSYIYMHRAWYKCVYMHKSYIYMHRAWYKCV